VGRITHNNREISGNIEGILREISGKLSGNL
jgi:hypothetical protein